MPCFAQPLLNSVLPCWVIGHRGAAAVRPENTLASFAAARDAGALMVEFDVQQSADGELVVFHDETLKRLCGTNEAVAILSWTELASRVVGEWQGQPTYMPRLDEVFAALGRSVFYNIELKTNVVRYPGIEARLVSLVQQRRLTERVLVSSFSHESLRNVREHHATLALGLLIDHTQAQELGSPTAIVARARAFDCYSVHPDYRVSSQWPELVTRCHGEGLRVFPWTVDDEETWRLLVEERAVDGIITNDPGRLYEWLTARQRSR